MYVTPVRVVWCWALTRDPATGGVVHRIHYMMVSLTFLHFSCPFDDHTVYMYVAIVDIALAQVSDAAVREYPLPLHIFVWSQRAVEYRVLLLRLFERY